MEALPGEMLALLKRTNSLEVCGDGCEDEHTTGCLNPQYNQSSDLSKLQPYEYANSHRALNVRGSGLIVAVTKTAPPLQHCTPPVGSG